jgi:hypothetical protein
MWNRPNQEFVQSQDLPWRPVPDDSFGAGGGVARELSTDPDDGALSALVRLRAPQRGRLHSGADLYVLDGAGTVNGRPYGPGHYLYLRPGAGLDLTPIGGPTTVFLGTFGPPDLTAGAGSGPGEVEHVDVESLAWSVPSWHGADAEEASAPDGAVKWLRRDDRGLVFISAKLPGWRSPREEVHPMYEESFRISGDFWVGAPGVMRAGSYFYHRPGFWHGPLYSRDGTASLIRADAEITTEYREPGLVDRPDADYRNLPHPALG